MSGVPPPLPPRAQVRAPVVSSQRPPVLVPVPTNSGRSPVVSDLEGDAERLFEAGKVIAGKYRLERPAGFGGMAELWVATNQATDAEVCVKLLIPSGEHEAEAVERFHREARAAAKLSHRAIVRVFDLLEIDENGEITKSRPRAYAIVMELLQGETVGDLLARGGKLPLAEALDLFLPVISALAHAHRASVIHRDIKPDNIFLARDPDGQIIPKVLDFGVSKLENAATITIDGVVLGTPAFMSPEQARGKRRLDARSDVFSSGVVFYMMLTGKNPFEEERAFASVVDAVVRHAVAPIDDLAPEIWAVLDKALQKDPALRFADATEMGIALRKAAGRRGSTESSAILPPVVPVSTRSLDASPAGSPPMPSSDSLAGSAETSGPPSSFTAPPETIAAKRRRVIVSAVVGVAVAIVVVAGIASMSSGAKATNTSAMTTANAAPRPPVSAISAAPELPSPAPSKPESGEDVGAVTESAQAPPTPTAKPLRSASPKSAAPIAPRKAGQEPSSARRPGF